MDLYPATLINAAYTRNQCQLQGIRGVHMCIGSFVGSRRLSMEQKTHTTQQKKGEDEFRVSQEFLSGRLICQKDKNGRDLYLYTNIIHILIISSSIFCVHFSFDACFFNFLGLLTFYFLTL
jgi:hypothetical protein